MNVATVDEKELSWITNSNESAASFVKSWKGYVHGIDDIIDGETKSAEGILTVFMHAAFLYSHPFYLENLGSLKQLVVNCTNAYADTVAWERDATPWKRSFADHYRHFAVEVIIAVAFICGGYEHMREVSKYLRTLCWTEHHDAKGESI